MKNLYEIVIKDPIDYDGKLNEHKDYIKMLNILEKNCSYIGITRNHEIVQKFKKDIFLEVESSLWWGMSCPPAIKLYYIKASKELFDFLRKYETFCKYIISPGKIDTVVKTDFGSIDIAFFNEKDEILLKTITHEGYIIVDKKIDELFNKFD